MNRRDFLKKFAAVGAGGLLLSNRTLEVRISARRPNIIYIMLDELGYFELSCMGNKYLKTPNIDQVATEGMRFTQALAGGPVCAPTRCVLMTGRHTGHATVRKNSQTWPMRADDVTVAEVLKKAGYATGGFGKWGCGDIRGIKKFEWDFTYDEVSFNSEYTEEPPCDGKTTYTYDVEGKGVYTVKLRVYDYATTAIATCKVYVGRVRLIDGTSQQSTMYTDIKPAIDAASDGDEIVVLQGLYTGDNNRDLNFDGKEITVRSINPTDPAVVAATIIDCDADYDNKHCGFYFDSDETNSSIVAGFTITGGYHANGGGIYCYSASPTITNCIITNNYTDYYGGGIYCEDGASPKIINCAITNNHHGEGIYCDGSSPTITNCTITGNTWAEISFDSYSSPKIINCTITNNYDGGIVGDDTSETITNCIVWGNGADQISPTGLNVTYCNVEGGYDDPEPGNTNISADPKFVDIDDPAGPDYLFCTLDDGLYLQNDSPCIDEGSNAAVPSDSADLDGDDDTNEKTPWDLKRDPRFADHTHSSGDTTAKVDMGAYEVIPVWYVDGDVGSSGTGKKLWTSAFKYLYEALDPAKAKDGHEIWVAAVAGTYTPDDSSRENSLVLQEDVSVYGGFDDGHEIARYERDWVNNETTLSGDLADNDGPGEWENNSENSYHVVKGADGAVLDGFTITAGYASSVSHPDDRGAGMLNSYASPSVTNCVFMGNKANNYGGGMCNRYNSAKVTNCFFSGNTADSGGGVSNTHSSVIVTNCVFTENKADYAGGAIRCNFYDYSIFTNCTITKNEAKNGETGKAGGMYNRGSSTKPRLINCIFWANEADSEGYEEIYNVESYPKPIFSFCDIDGGLNETKCGGNDSVDAGDNIAADPEFVTPLEPPEDYKPKGPDDDFGTFDDGLRLQDSSPCIDIADGDAASSTDILDLGRIDASGVENTGFGDPDYADIGAYEYGPLVVVMCWIDETYYQSYYSNPDYLDYYSTDLADYRELIKTTNEFFVKSGCLVPLPHGDVGPPEGPPHTLEAVLPEGYFDPAPVPESISPNDRPKGFSIYEFKRNYPGPAPTLNDFINHFNRIRGGEGVVPDYLCLSVDTSESLNFGEAIEPHYSYEIENNFIYWLETEYDIKVGNGRLIRRDIDEFWDERWIKEMTTAIEGINP